ncbi:hypothetical protein C8Q79DRAFT_576447 [Trametes meyenii]|nr:hypothetical protein C8Q79DRAFT_576447 [Trametes meyenii]
MLDCDLLSRLVSCPSLLSLTLLEYAAPANWADVNASDARPRQTVQLPLLKLLTIQDWDRDALNFLCHIDLPSCVRIRLSIDPDSDDPDGFRRIFTEPSLLRCHIMPYINHLYLGNTRAKGRVRLLGFTSTGEERLDIGRWRDDEDALRDLLSPFSSSGVTSLSINLPTLPPMMQDFPWDNLDTLAPLPLLRRMELLGGTPLETKRRFVRWFWRSALAVGTSSPGELTLCWVLNVERGRDEAIFEEL